MNQLSLTYEFVMVGYARAPEFQWIIMICFLQVASLWMCYVRWTVDPSLLRVQQLGIYQKSESQREQMIIRWALGYLMDHDEASLE